MLDQDFYEELREKGQVFTRVTSYSEADVEAYKARVENGHPDVEVTWGHTRVGQGKWIGHRILK